VIAEIARLEAVGSAPPNSERNAKTIGISQATLEDVMQKFCSRP
jgi:hypothetical protein